jgi:GH24 family phage-related lysozyme (muramidase)
MTISEAGIQLIKSFEGCHNSPYRCPAGLWTIGYGHVLYPDQARLKTPERASYALKPEHDRVWDAIEIDSLLEKDLLRYTNGVLRYCPAAVDNQCHLDAITSLAFNIGLGNLQASTLIMKYARCDYAGAADEFLKWRKANGVVLRGLERRREAERALFLSGG